MSDFNSSDVVTGCRITKYCVAPFLVLSQQTRLYNRLPYLFTDVNEFNRCQKLKRTELRVASVELLRNQI